MTPPRYQSITRDGVRLLTSHDGGALIRLIAGDIVGFTGPGDTQPLDVLVLGGLPIREPIAHDGPFVMNTRGEIIQAIEDYRAGRLGIIPADQSAPRNLAPVDR
jgi:redox-sensitive bicupin YhaK (pirin superfamily)